MASVYTNILNAVCSEIQSLQLEGISPANVVIGKVPTDRQGLLPSLPGILIAPFGSSTIVGGSNLRDDIAYPVLIALLQASNTSQTENRDRALLWSESISRAFRNQRLADVPTVNTCRLKSDTKFNASQFFTANLDVNVIVLQFENRETRG